MSEDGESNSSSHKNLNFQIKPYAKRKAIFNPEIFGTPKRQRNLTKTPDKKDSSVLYQLWSKPRKETKSEFKENSSNESKDGNATNNRSLLYGSRQNARSIYQRQPRQIKTRIERDTSELIIPPSAKEIFATLDRLTRPINRDPSHGWMSLREAERKPIPKPGQPGGPPVGWRAPSKWNREKVGIPPADRARIQQYREESLSRESSRSEPVSRTSEVSTGKSSNSGVGKIRNKMTRMHESRNVEIVPEIPSYNLETVPKLSLPNTIELDDGPQLCSTPQVKPRKITVQPIAKKEVTVKLKTSSMPPANVRYLTLDKNPQEIKLFSQPKKERIWELSSQDFDSSGESSSFSFSQPKRLNKLAVDSEEKEKKVFTPKKRKGDTIVKINYPGFKDKKKEEKKEDNDDKKDSDGKSEQKETPGKGLNTIKLV